MISPKYFLRLLSGMTNPLTALRFLTGNYTKGTPLTMIPRKGSPFIVARDADKWILADFVQGKDVKTADTPWGPCFEKDGILLRQGTSDTYIYKELVIDQCYDELIQSLEPQATVLDIGAHIGLFAKMAGDNSERVIAFEADKSNFALAENNLSGLENITIHNKAVWSSSNERLFMDRPSEDNTCTYSATTEGEGRGCESISLDDIFSESDISECSLLKMDIEGGEYKALIEGQPQCLDRVKSICLEYHPDPGGKYTRDDLIKLLRERGFRILIRPISSDTGIIIGRRTGNVGKPTFSVVIPTMNRRHELLEKSVDCALNQTNPPEEILIINNGMGDVPDSWKTNRVKIYNLPNKAGVAQARNAGVSLASSDYVSFLDDDDLWEKDYLKKIAAIADEEAPDCIIARLDRMDGDAISQFKNAHGGITKFDILTRNPGITGSTTTVCRTSFLAVGGYNPTLPPSEDKTLILEMLLREYHVATAPDAQSIMRFHAGERLSDPAFMEKGITNFLSSYAHIMTFSQQASNRAKALRYRAMHSNAAWNKFLALSWKVTEAAYSIPRAIFNRFITLLGKLGR